MSKINTNIALYLFLIICLYIYIFNPYLPFLSVPIGSIKLLYIPLAFFLLQKTKKYRLFKNENKQILNYFICLFVFVVIRYFTGGSPLIIRDITSATIEAFFLPCYLLYLLDKCGISEKKIFIKQLLIISAIAALISISAFIFPSFHQFIRDNFLYIKEDSFLDLIEWRGYGIAECLTSIYSYDQALLCIIWLFYLKKNKWYTFFLPATLFSIVFNARTGIILFFVGIVIYFIHNRNLFYATLISLFLFFFSDHYEDFFKVINVSEDAIAWIQDFSTETDEILESGLTIESGTTSTLFGRMMVLPETPEQWLYGRGYSLFGKREELGVSSDIGFINNLSYGGIIYCVLLYTLIVIVSRKLIKHQEYWLFFLFLSFFLIIHTKGNFMPSAGILRLFMLIFYFFCDIDKKYKSQLD